MIHSEQIKRIKNKLLKAKKTDKTLKVFGADSHKYILKPTVSIRKVSEFEKKYDLQLPNCYKDFITEIGNGGISYAHSAAGPFYGIYPLGENVDELIFNNTEKYLKNKCIIYPKMTNEYWDSLTKNINDNDDISDKEYEQELGKIYSGVLPIGSQGCTYIHGIVLNGKYKGQVVNLDMDGQKPRFTFEKTFLDWYERWLDEVISGELIKEGASWFGYTRGGSEDKLLSLFISSDNLEDKKDYLSGLLNKNTLTIQTLNQIEKLINNGAKPNNLLIQLLCKSNYEKAKPYLIELVKTDLLSVFQFIFWYAKDKSKEWLIPIQNNINRIDNYDTFLFCTYLLSETNSDFSNLIIPFTKNENEKIRAQAFYVLGKSKNKKAYIDIFINGLNDDSTNVIRTTLQALNKIKDIKLLKHYKNIAQKFPIEKDYILVNLNHQLADYGLTNKTILEKNLQNFNIKRWYEIWK
jgi:hypothetical protein